MTFAGSDAGGEGVWGRNVRNIHRGGGESSGVNDWKSGRQTHGRGTGTRRKGSLRTGEVLLVINRFPVTVTTIAEHPTAVLPSTAFHSPPPPPPPRRCGLPTATVLTINIFPIFRRRLRTRTNCSTHDTKMPNNDSQGGVGVFGDVGEFQDVSEPELVTCFTPTPC